MTHIQSETGQSDISFLSLAVVSEGGLSVSDVVSGAAFSGIQQKPIQGIQGVPRQIKNGLTLVLNGKHPLFSDVETGFKIRSGDRVRPGPNTFNCRKQSVSIISVCQGIDTQPVLNFE